MTSNPARLAITGGTGFVGQYVIKEALSRGLTVRALVRSPKKISLQHDNLEWFSGSLGQNDHEFVADMDCVIHIAGLIKAKNRQIFMAANSVAAGNLAQAAQQGKITKFVLLSSQAASQAHLSDYAASKAAGEDAVSKAYSGKRVIIRAPAVIGPGDEATAPFFTFIQKGILPVPGGRGWRERRLSMVYVEDLARVIVDAATTKEYDGKTVVPATLQDTDWDGFAKLWSEAAGRPVKAVPVPLSLLYPVAQATSISSALFGIGHLTRGKLREFLHADWSSEQLIPGATPPIDALTKTLSAYMSDSEN